MNISIYQIVLGIIASLFLINSLLKFAKKEKNQTFFKFFIATIIWGSVLFFAIIPGVTHTISKKLGMGENLNTLIFTGFVLIFIIIFKLINTIEKLQKNISEIVRKEALRKLEND